VFSLTLKSTDKKPVRYEQASELRRKTDGTCETDFDAGDPAPIPGEPQPQDGGSGNGNGGGNGGITAGYADPIHLAVTELWVGQSFTYDDLCIYNQSAWPGAWQLVQSGWVDVGYQFSSGMQGPCPHCPMGTGYMGASYASATNGAFANSVFCYLLTGNPGAVTFTDYLYVSDYGMPGGSTVWTFSSTATGGCSVLLHSFFTFTQSVLKPVRSYHLIDPVVHAHARRAPQDDCGEKRSMWRKGILAAALVALPVSLVAIASMAYCGAELVSPCVGWGGSPPARVTAKATCKVYSVDSRTRAQAVGSAAGVQGVILLAAALALWGTVHLRQHAVVGAGLLMLLEIIPTLFSLSPLALFAGVGLLVVAYRMPNQTALENRF